MPMYLVKKSTFRLAAKGATPGAQEIQATWSRLQGLGARCLVKHPKPPVPL